jgi:hypothetical protein
MLFQTHRRSNRWHIDGEEALEALQLSQRLQVLQRSQPTSVAKSQTVNRYDEASSAQDLNCPRDTRGHFACLRGED